MKLKLEQLETRRMLAADIEVIQVPSQPGQVGQEVTRIIRVYSDESTEVNVRSSLTNELEDPTWRRLDTYGRRYTEIEDLKSPVVRLKGLTDAKQIGDFNGDGIVDTLVSLSREESVVVFGGQAVDFDLTTLSESTTCGPACGNIGPRIRSPEIVRGDFPIEPEVESRNLGDINGDGLDDLVFTRLGEKADRLAIVYGSAEANWDTIIELEDSPSQFVSIVGDISEMTFVGDVNDDGFADVVVGRWTEADWGPANAGTKDAHLVYGSDAFQPNTSLTLDTIPLRQALALGSPTIQHPAAAGDFNNDGIADFLYSNPRHPRNIRMQFGSVDGTASSVIIPDVRETGLSGWMVFEGADDFNGDGISDLLFSFRGRNCNCGASGRPHVGSGVQIIMGRSFEVTSANVEAMFSDRTEIVIDVESPFNDFPIANFATFVDSDGDQYADVSFPTSNLGRIVIRGSKTPQTIDFGHVWDGTTGFDGQYAYGMGGAPGFGASRFGSGPGVGPFVDINGDGLHDIRRGEQFYLGQPSRLFTGFGDIRDTVHIGANQSVTYEITGILKDELSQIETVAIVPGEIEAVLGNNVISPRTGVLLELHADTAEDQWQFVVTNRGPHHAIGVEIESTVASLEDMTWQQTTRLFPPEIKAHQLDPGMGTNLMANINSPSIFFPLNEDGGRYLGQVHRYYESRFYEHLGKRVGSLGDVNGDGFDDIYVDWTQDRASQDRLGPTHQSVFFGNADFGHSGFLQDVDSTFEPKSFSTSDATLGDINGDGFDDAIRVERFEWPLSGDPEVQVIFGGPEIDISELPSDFDGQNGFRVTFPTSLFDIEPTVISDFDINGDGIDDLLIGERHAGPSGNFGGHGDHGAVYLILGRSAVDLEGAGEINQRIDIAAGSTITYAIRGALPEDQELQGNVVVRVAEDQISLDSQVKRIKFGEPEFLPGDVDRSGAVNFADFLILSTNFGKTPNGDVLGDLNHDQVIDFDDFLILLENFGRTAKTNQN